ncbi:MAG: nucleotide-binding protein [Lysobacteraceae bacterium]
MVTPTITCFVAKGGAGKTTLALNLAAAFAADGLRVLLIDADPQGSSLVWAKLDAEREHTFTVSSHRSPGFDLHIIDADKNPLDYMHGHLVVVPAVLDGQNNLSVRYSLGYLKEQGKQVLVVPNRVRTDRAEQRLLLSNYADQPMLRERAAFASAYARGATVYDPLPIPHLAKARAEVDAVKTAITDRLPQLKESES